MAIIEYDRSPNITPEQRLKSLADSVRRAFEEIETFPESGTTEKVEGKDPNAYPRTGGTIEGDAIVAGSFTVDNGSPSSFTGNMFVAIDEETQALCEQTLGADMIDYMKPNDEILEIATDEGVKYLINCIYPIGHIIENTSADFDPNTAYSWQTWERYGNGRVTVGVDEVDGSFSSVGLEVGEKTHTLTVSEMPAHKHTYSSNYLALTALGLGGSDTGSDISGSGKKYPYIASSNSWWCQAMQDAGGGLAHNNIQPSVTVYRWRRVS